MGIIQKEYLIVELWGKGVGNADKLKALDRYIKGLKPEYRELFFKNETQTNGYITYFMSWDGSKEGWDVSERANSIRNHFIVLAKKLDAKIYHVETEGNIVEVATITKK